MPLLSNRTSKITQILTTSIVVRSAPYGLDVDDILEITTSLAILLTLLAGFALKTQSESVAAQDPDADSTYEDGMMAALLIFMNSLVLGVGVLATFLATPCMSNIEIETIPKKLHNYCSRIRKAAPKNEHNHDKSRPKGLDEYNELELTVVL